MEKEVIIDDIAVIIVVYHPTEQQMAKITRLASIYNGVVYDNTPDVTMGIDRIGRMIYMSSAENVGIASAQNRAIGRINECRYLVFLDQDTKVDDGFPLDIAREYSRCRLLLPNLAILGPSYSDGKERNAYKSRIYNDKYAYDNIVTRKNIISSGSCVERCVFDEIGGYEDKLFIDYVDSEWCWRAVSKGYLCCLTENLSMVHRIGEKVIELGPIKDILSSPPRYYYQYRNYIWMLNRRYVPLKWKVNVGCKCVLRLLYLPFYSHSCKQTYRYIMHGIYDGIFK